MIIEGTEIEIPDSLVVEGDLYLRDRDIKSLPNELTVTGNLNLCYTNIESLPDYLSVGGDLYLQCTNVTSLPAGLSVGGALDLGNTNISTLPNNLQVKTIFADDKQLTASEEQQIELIANSKSIIHALAAPTKKAKRLHQLLWEL